MGRRPNRTCDNGAGAVPRPPVGAGQLLRRRAAGAIGHRHLLRRRRVGAAHSDHAVGSGGDRPDFVDRADAAGVGERLRRPRSDLLVLFHAPRSPDRIGAPGLARRDGARHVLLADGRGSLRRAGTGLTISTTQPDRGSIGASTAGQRRSLWTECGLSAVLYFALTLAFAYPLSLHPATRVLPVGADVNLYLWTLQWDVHALTHRPLSIFDANIYYPFRHTLAYSENLIGSAMLAAPILWIGGSPILALNIVALLSCVLCGAGTYL